VEELVEYLARGLVDKPDEVNVERVERDGAIGRQGRIVRALRTLVRASGARSNERVLLEIVG